MTIFDRILSEALYYRLFKEFLYEMENLHPPLQSSAMVFQRYGFVFE